MLTTHQNSFGVNLLIDRVQAEQGEKGIGGFNTAFELLGKLEFKFFFFSLQATNREDHGYLHVDHLSVMSTCTFPSSQRCTV